MFCKNCGAEIKQGARFCENCGAPVAGASDEKNRHTSPQKKPHKAKPKAGNSKSLDSFFADKRRMMIIIVVAAVLVACIIGGLIWHSHSQKVKYDGYMQTASELMTNGDYDQAEMILNESIQLRPKEPQAYLTLASVYTEKKEYHKTVVILRQGAEKTGKDEVFKAPLERAEVVYSNTWKSAYKEILDSNSDLIYDYEYGREEYEQGRNEVAALYDMDKDGTPELWFFTYIDYAAELNIYTYADGKATKLPYKCVYYWKGNDKQDDDGFHDLYAAGGMNYIVFSEEGKNGFTVCSEITDESTNTEINSYTYESGKISYPDFLDCIHYYIGMDGTANESYECTQNGSDISQKDYEKAKQRIIDNMDQVIITNTLFSRDEKLYKEFLSAAETRDSLGMTYEEITDALKPAKVEAEDKENKTDDSEKNNSEKDDSDKNDAESIELFSKLSEGGFYFTSGAGAWATDLKFNEDGSFSGYYHDSNMGEDMETYPNGTAYVCDFSGKFKDVKKTGEHEYTMTLDGDIKLEQPVDSDTVKDDTHIIYSEPYGLETLSDGDTVTVIEPGYPLNDLDEAFLDWIRMPQAWETVPDTADTYYLLNPKGGDYGGYAFIFGED